MPPVVLWLRRDVRLHDHPALVAAAEHARASGAPLLPIFVWEPGIIAGPRACANRNWFLRESLAEFAPGTGPVMLPVGTHRASTAICYEVVYPSLVRDAVRDGSELITTITNDAWYGRTSAPFQHFELASLRAVEQGRYLVRAANTGISGIVCEPRASPVT